MIKRPSVALGLLLMVFSSCQKELHFPPGDDNNNGGDDDSTITLKPLLIKAVAVTGSDTLTTLYSYDSERRLETQTTDGISSGDTIHHYARFTRDGATRIVAITEQLKQTGIAYDTMRTRIYYPNATGMEYIYSVGNSLYGGVESVDSIIYTFDTSKMLSAQTYTSIPDLAIPYTPTERNEFAYNSEGNVAKRDYYSYNGFGLLFTATYNFSYDDNPDYGWYSENAAQNYLLIGVPNILSKNISRLDVVDQTGNAQNVSILTTLTMGDNEQPSSGIVTINPLHRTTNYTFYYQ